MAGTLQSATSVSVGFASIKYSNTGVPLWTNRYNGGAFSVVRAMALDSSGSFSNVDFERSPHWPRWFKRRTATGVRPALISDGGSPLVVAPDGNLYYVCNDDRMIPGGLLIARLTPDGRETLLSSAFRHTSDELGGIKGLAVGPDASLYASYPKAVLKFGLDGKVTTLLNPVLVADCDKDPSSSGDAPSLRGLVVDARGTV